MKIFTYQIAKWRKVRRMKLIPIDTTIMTGEAMLAPTWTLVRGHKDGVISDEEYELVYMDLLRDRYAQFPDYFEWLANQPVVALGCYCKPGNFCHRHLIVKFLKEITEVEYKGEIEDNKP